MEKSSFNSRIPTVAKVPAGSWGNREGGVALKLIKNNKFQSKVREIFFAIYSNTNIIFCFSPFEVKMPHIRGNLQQLARNQRRR